MSRNNGGPAFPNGWGGIDEQGNDVYIGMSLRDWFAGMAMQGLWSLGMVNLERIRSKEDGKSILSIVAELAYEEADIMIAERGKVSDVRSDETIRFEETLKIIKSLELTMKELSTNGFSKERWYTFDTLWTSSRFVIQRLKDEIESEHEVYT